MPQQIHPRASKYFVVIPYEVSPVARSGFDCVQTRPMPSRVMSVYVMPRGSEVSSVYETTIQFVGAPIGCVEIIRSSNHMAAAGVVVDPFAPLK